MLNTSDGTWPKSSLFEIHASGVALDKLVIGKPALAAGDANNGYIDPSTLGGCLATAKNGGWSACCCWRSLSLSRMVRLTDARLFSADAGVMVWEVRVFRWLLLWPWGTPPLTLLPLAPQFPDAAASWIQTVRSQAFPE